MFPSGSSSDGLEEDSDQSEASIQGLQSSSEDDGPDYTQAS